MAEINYSSLYDSKYIDEALRKLLSIDIDGQNWIVIPSSDVAPINLNSITISGNYVVEYYTNGPDIDEFEINEPHPVTIIVNEADAVITQIFIAGFFTCFRTNESDIYTQWQLPTDSTPIYRGATAPDMTKINHSNLWMDISDLNYPTLKRYNGADWIVILSKSYLTYNAYDNYNRRLSIAEYIQTAISKIYTTLLDVKNSYINTRSPFHSSAFNRDVIIASTNDEYLLKSTNGSTWMDIHNEVLPSGSYIIAYNNNGSFVAVIDNAVTNKVYHSVDGNEWGVYDLPINNVWISIICSNDGIMLYGKNGNVITSIDGFIWKQCGIPNGSSNGVLITNENTIVFLDVVNKASFVTKNNGGVWDNVTLPILDASISIKNGVYGDGKFVLLLSNGDIQITEDFKTWTLTIPNNTIIFNTLIFHKQLFILVSSNMLQYSYDCMTWFHYAFNGPSKYFTVLTNNSLIVTSTLIDRNTCNIFKIVDMSIRSSDHINDSIMHITEAERTLFNTKQSTADMSTKVTQMIADIDSYADIETNKSRDSLEVVETKDTLTNAAIITHEETTDTPKVEDKSLWNSKANGSHVHKSDDKIEIHANKVVSGVLDISRMPESALNRLVTVVGIPAMYALTTTSAQNGDTIRVIPTIIPQTVDLSELRSICFGNGKFIAIPSINTNGSILTSTNGVDWYVEIVPSELAWQDIIYGNGLFVIVSTTNKILTSINGSIWTEYILPESTYGDIIGYGNGLFIIIRKNSDVILTSPDAITWTSTTIPKSLDWTAVSYGDGHFILVASNSPTFMISSNGIVWTEVSVTSRYYNAICIDNQVCIAVGANEVGAITTQIIRSTNGISWDDITLPLGAIWKSICFDNGLFVLIGTDIESKTIMLISIDNGITWVERKITANVIWSKIVVGNGTFVAIDSVSDKIGSFSKSIIFSMFYRVTDDTKLNISDGYISFNSTSAGLIDWANVTDRGNSILDYGIEDLYTQDLIDGKFPVLKDDITSNIDEVIIIAEDEIDVIDDDLATHLLDGIKHITYTERTSWNSKSEGNHEHILDPIVEIVGEDVVSGVIDMDRIPDEAIAKIVVYPYKSSLYSLTTANVQNGDVVKITNSPKSVDTGIIADWRYITYGNGLFVAIAWDSDIIITSPDGITWTLRTVPVSAKWKSITYGNGLFVAIASNSTIIITSIDGITWTQRTLPVSKDWSSITYGNEMFVVIAYNSTDIIILNNKIGTTSGKVQVDASKIVSGLTRVKSWRWR